jgi:hypothetical protein
MFTYKNKTQFPLFLTEKNWKAMTLSWNILIKEQNKSFNTGHMTAL